MTRGQHLLLQAFIQGMQMFVSYPGVVLPVTVVAGIHSFLAGASLITLFYAQQFNTDGTPQTLPYKPPTTPTTPKAPDVDPQGGARD
jgi:hypothetical protein